MDGRAGSRFAVDVDGATLVLVQLKTTRRHRQCIGDPIDFTTLWHQSSLKSSNKHLESTLVKRSLVHHSIWTYRFMRREPLNARLVLFILTAFSGSGGTVRYSQKVVMNHS